ncbi:recombinase family protein [Oscillospiraceae bacterium 38-13]
MIQVAAYCRVSTNREDQANSFESQRRYFEEYILQQPEWALFKIYADEGVTGTSTKKREAFLRMLDDAHQGCFQLLLTKEVSRFSRNILDAISYTRELKALGVGVIFLNDGIHTLDPDGELRLSILGSLAQEESRRTSSRVKWGQTRRMERGVVFGRSLLGYDVRDGKLLVNPGGAEVVRLIFQKYGLEKKGTSVIARELQEAGCRTRDGDTRWSHSHIIKILRNEKYVGDLIQKKTFTPDYLTHEKHRNHGEEPLIVLRDHHEPIVDRALWDLVQEELRRRRRRGAADSGGSSRYILSGKLRCGTCGAAFSARKRTRKDGSFYRRWSCGSAGCDMRRSLREETALEILRHTLSTLELGEAVRNVTALALEALEAEDRPAALEAELLRLRRKKADALDAFLSGDINREDLALVKGRYDAALEDLSQKRDALLSRRRETAELAGEAERRTAAIARGDLESGVFLRTILDRMVFYREGRVEVTLCRLPHRWTFALEDGGP